MSEWWAALWFFLPAGIANMAPVLVAKLPLSRNWNTPLDLGKLFRGKVICGKNKTWRGLTFGVLAAIITGIIQCRIITSSIESIWFIIAVSGLMGFGALVGDAVESIIKRQLNINPGETWFPFDQIDYIIGGLLFATIIVDLSLVDITRVFILYFGLHITVSYLGFLLGLKKKPI